MEEGLLLSLSDKKALDEALAEAFDDARLSLPLTGEKIPSTHALIAADAVSRKANVILKTKKTEDDKKNFREAVAKYLDDNVEPPSKDDNVDPPPSKGGSRRRRRAKSSKKRKGRKSRRA
jgi:hypothetical protein